MYRVARYTLMRRMRLADNLGMMKTTGTFRIVGLFLCAVVASVSCPAHAEPAAPPPPARENYVGALVGAGIITSSSGGSYFTFSGRVGAGLFADPNGIFSLGAYVNYGSNSVSTGALKTNGTFTTIASELITRKMLGSGAYLGGRFGVGLDGASVTSGATSVSASAVSFAVGPVAGYELGIVPNLNIDLDLSWLTHTASTFTFPGIGSVQGSSLGTFLMQAGLTFHW